MRRDDYVEDKRHVSRRLNDLSSIAVDYRQYGTGDTARNTADVETEIFPGFIKDGGCCGSATTSSAPAAATGCRASSASDAASAASRGCASAADTTRASSAATGCCAEGPDAASAPPGGCTFAPHTTAASSAGSRTCGTEAAGRTDDSTAATG